MVKGIFSSPAASIVARRAAGCLVGEPAWTVSIRRSSTDSSIRPWEAVTSRRRARSSLREHAEVRVGEHAALQRPFAGPDDVGGEVLVAPGRQPFGDHRVDLGLLAGQDQQLLGVAFQRLVEDPFDLLGGVDVGLVGGEGAVLAVALAGPREREREVPREGDPSHPARLSNGLRAQTGAERKRGGSEEPPRCDHVFEKPSRRAPRGAAGYLAELGSGVALTRCGGSEGEVPPASITKRKTPTASRAPTIGPTR